MNLHKTSKIFCKTLKIFLEYHKYSAKPWSYSLKFHNIISQLLNVTILFPNVTKLFPNVTILFTKVVFKNSNIVKSESAEPPKSASVNLGKYRKYSFQFSAANKHLHFYYFATDWPYQENIAVFWNIYWNDLSSKLFLFQEFSRLSKNCLDSNSCKTRHNTPKNRVVLAVTT